MFLGEKDARARATEIVKRLGDFTRNKTNERHIHYDEARDIGLKVSQVEDDQELQDLIVTVHHCFMHALMNTSSFKLIENHLGAALVKQQGAVKVPAR